MSTTQPDFKRQVKDVLATVTARLLPSGLMRDKKYFDLWQKRGFHVTINHFYEPVPDTRSLATDTFVRERIPAGININEEAQVRLLQEFRANFKAEYDALPENPVKDPLQFHLRNGAYEDVDAEILYCMVRHLQPRRIIEIGSGFSTLLTAQACRKNESEGAPACNFTAIEPYPNAALQRGIPGLTTLVAEPVQSVDPAVFQSLEAGDILFIDSSHVLKIGSDVQFEFLELIPNLPVGVHVHLHDIFIPQEYPESWIKENRWFWSEQYLLEAFLAFNQSFEITWAGRYMHLRHPNMLAQAFRSYASFAGNGERHWPASFWMKRVA